MINRMTCNDDMAVCVQIFGKDNADDGFWNSKSNLNVVRALRWALTTRSGGRAPPLASGAASSPTSASSPHSVPSRAQLSRDACKVRAWRGSGTSNALRGARRNSPLVQLIQREKLAMTNKGVPFTVLSPT